MIPPSFAKPAWLLGLDLGQRHDYTALATIELLWTCTGRRAVSFEHVWQPTLNLCGLRRFPLGTSYAEYPKIVARRIQQVNAAAGRLPFAPAGIFLVIDAAGPGAPIVDELRRAHLDATIHPMLITGGAAPGYASNGYETVPRRRLISNLILLLHHKVLRWAGQLPLRHLLEKELLGLSGGTTHPAEAGGHDDLVMAVAIACWQAKCHSPRILPKTKDGAAGYWTPQGPLF
jgi:hypothetical protein